MRKMLLGAAIATLCFPACQSFAASAGTDAFIANVRLNAAFLARSSQLVADRSDNRDLHAFADREIESEDAIISTVDRRTAPEVAQAVPLTVAANEVMTGRSAAVDTVAVDADFSAPAGTGAMMPAAALTIGHLAASKGQAFDALYKKTQIDALLHLSGLYNAYAMTGDDPALKQMSKNQLDATNKRIAEIARF